MAGGVSLVSYNRYLLIERWKRDRIPDRLRRLSPGTKVVVKGLGVRKIERVGIGKILVEGEGWFHWRDVNVFND